MFKRRMIEASADLAAPAAIPVDRDLYKLHRDYIQHEDGLIGIRLGSFLTLTSFLLAASMIILSGMLTAVTRKIPVVELMMVLTLGTIVHLVLARLGYLSARLTDTSIRAAISSLGLVRDAGNRLFADQIRAGLVPPLTNGRLLKPDELDQMESGTKFMRHLPAHMLRLWIVIGAAPVLLQAAALAMRLLRPASFP